MLRNWKGNAADVCGIFQKCWVHVFQVDKDILTDDGRFGVWSQCRWRIISDSQGDEMHVLLVLRLEMCCPWLRISRDGSAMKKWDFGRMRIRRSFGCWLGAWESSEDVKKSSVEVGKSRYKEDCADYLICGDERSVSWGKRVPGECGAMKLQTRPLIENKCGGFRLRRVHKTVSSRVLEV